MWSSSVYVYKYKIKFRLPDTIKLPHKQAKVTKLNLAEEVPIWVYTLIQVM